MPTNVTSTTATLNGMVNPMGKISTFAFNYGLTNTNISWRGPSSSRNAVETGAPNPIDTGMAAMKPATMRAR